MDAVTTSEHVQCDITILRSNVRRTRNHSVGSYVPRKFTTIDAAALNLAHIQKRKRKKMFMVFKYAVKRDKLSSQSSQDHHSLVPSMK